MSFDYKSCFWDPNDDGVNILLQHVSQGIKSLSTLEQFFKLQSDLNKDHSRRTSAIEERLNKDLLKNPDFGQLNNALSSLSVLEKTRAAAFSKQAEFIQGQLYAETKLFNESTRAHYITITGKIGNLRKDKFDKRKGCEELTKRLKEAELKFRDYKLNENNIIGSKRIEQNNKEIIKWETNVKEISSQLSILKNEYKASQKFWLNEWAVITDFLQKMEMERIIFIQTKLQQFININSETSILEQTKLDWLNNELTTFTPMDDISKFASDFGTGRLKEKKRQRPQSMFQQSTISHQQSTISHQHSTTSTQQSTNSTPHQKDQMSKRESYMENIRQLSNQLQKTHVSRNDYNTNNTKIINQSPYHNLPQSPHPLQSGFNDNNNNSNQMEKPLPVIKQRTKTVTSQNRFSLHESQLPSYSNQHETINNQKITQVSDTIPQHNKTESESSTTSSSSNPTDFTSNLNRRRSIESMSTSVTSMASSIDDNQRFAKSWNSTNNRKRKSMSHIASYLENQSIGNTNTHNNEQTKSRSLSPSFVETRQPSTNTILMKSLDNNNNNNITSSRSRRKSLVVNPSSSSPIEDALLEMNKLQGGIAKDSKLGRVNDNGIIVTLPIVTRSGNPVIKYAKAKYPLLDNQSNEIINFDKNDYLLITEEINEEWFLGEVYDNERIDPNHRIGLIPFNFIHLLE